MNEFGLNDRNMAELLEILSSFPAIEKAVVYGSRARGDFKPYSDIDITLLGKDLTFHDVAMLDDKLYYSYLPYFFDTSIFTHLNNEELKENIKREGKVIYQRTM